VDHTRYTLVYSTVDSAWFNYNLTHCQRVTPVAAGSRKNGDGWIIIFSRHVVNRADNGSID